MTTLIFYKVSPFYGLVSLKRVERIEPYDFASFSSLPGKITVLELNNLLEAGELQFESTDFLSVINNNKQKGTDKLESIALKIKSGLDCLLSKRDLNIFKTAFKIDASTTENEVSNICLNFASHYRLHGKRITILRNKIMTTLFDDYTISIATPAQIAESYSRFNSCMDKYADKMPLFYGVPYNSSGNVSVGVLIFWHKDTMQGRAVYRIKGNKVAAYYGSERVVFNALCKRTGYKTADCSALIGARMPIVLDSNGALLMPYIDCQDKTVSLKIDDTEGNYLVIGTKLDSLILLGTADSQKLELNNRSTEYDDYFNDNYEKMELCSNCDCEVDEDEYSTDYNGNILCSECAGYCENCDETVLQDDMVPALSEQRGSYYRIYVCSCCADNADEHLAVF